MRSKHHPHLTTKLYIQSMGKLFRVGAICKTAQEANDICESDTSLGVIAEDKRNRIYVAELEPLCKTPQLIDEHIGHSSRNRKLSLTNHCTLYIKSMLKVFPVTHICDTIEEFDEFRKTHKNDVLLGTLNSGLHFVGSQYSGIAPSYIIPE